MELTTALISVKVLGSRRLMRRLGTAEPAATGPTTAAGIATDRHRAARRFAGLVDRVADVLPLPLNCLPRAMATRSMLRRRQIPCELHLGITGTAPLAAHAWITTEGVVVQGGPVKRITELARVR